MGTAKLITFFDLLSAGYTVAQLATAVETHGATGWDRFGRFGAFPPNTVGAKQALDALSDYRAFETGLLFQMQSELDLTDGECTVVGSPLDEIADFRDAGIHRFGWTTDAMPSIDRTELHPAVPMTVRKTGQPRPSAILNILGAILLYFEVRNKAGTTHRMPSQADLIGKLCEENVGVDGISESNLQKQFAEARRSVKGARIKS
jgi:hypothetical protein